MIGGDEADDGDGQAGCQVQEAGLGVSDGGAAQDADPGQGDEGDEQAVDALRTGEQLEDQALCELIRILCHDASGGLTSLADAPSGTCTGQASCESSTEKCPEHSHTHFSFPLRFRCT